MIQKMIEGFKKVLSCSTICNKIFIIILTSVELFQRSLELVGLEGRPGRGRRVRSRGAHRRHPYCGLEKEKKKNGGGGECLQEDSHRRTKHFITRSFVFRME